MWLHIRILEKISFNAKFIGTDPLDLVKFICKEFWEEVFRKKVSRGVYIFEVDLYWLTPCKL